MTPDFETLLTRDIAVAIRAKGPISVSRYMDLCLNHPEHGYSRRRPTIGAAGDFVTAPEISQIFGELIGVWCAVVWRQMGEPSRVRLVEFGPGRGTLMRDALRAARGSPAFVAALSVCLVEQNQALRAEQQRTLGIAPCPVAWGTAPDDLASDDTLVTIVIANEFLDVLPRDQILFDGGSWVERNVGLSDSGELIFVAGPPCASVPVVHSEPRKGDVFERSDIYTSFLTGWVRSLNVFAGLFIDYGHERSGFGDTLQAVRGHQPVSPLVRCGEADLTMQVDFEAFAEASKNAGLIADGPVTQAEFLGSIGAVERASTLMAANPARAADIEASLARLISPGGMGVRFKAIGLRTATVKLPGFAPDANLKSRGTRV